MSTETPRSIYKKERKDKKRKREQEQDASQTTEEPVSKKKKKSRGSEITSSAPPVEDTPTKKPNKSKHATAEAPTPTPSTSSKPKSTTSASFSDSKLSMRSPFTQLTTSFYIPLSPCANNFPLEGACAEHLSPLLLTYYPPLHGVVLSYSNARLSEEPTAESKNGTREILSKSVDEFGGTFLWLTADFVLLRPVQGTYMEGYVSLQNESVLGLMCYNYFNAAVERSQLPSDWKWTGDDAAEGDDGSGNYYVDSQGKKVEGRVVFRVKDFKADGGAGTINIIGSLLSEEGDKASCGKASTSTGKKEKKKMT